MQRRLRRCRASRHAVLYRPNSLKNPYHRIGRGVDMGHSMIQGVLGTIVLGRAEEDKRRRPVGWRNAQTRTGEHTRDGLPQKHATSEGTL